MKKITLATVKSFIKRNLNDLQFIELSRFDGMTDGIERNENPKFRPANVEKFNPKDAYQMGIPGVWFVGGSHDYISKVDSKEWTGYEVSNCCGNWKIAISAKLQAAANERDKWI